MALLKRWEGKGVSEKHIFPCDCSDNHYLAIWRHSDEYDTLSIEEHWVFRSWRDKVGGVWNVLRGRPAYATEIILDKRTRAEIIEILKEELPEE